MTNEEMYVLDTALSHLGGRHRGGDWPKAQPSGAFWKTWNTR